MSRRLAEEGEALTFSPAWPHAWEPLWCRGAPPHRGCYPVAGGGAAMARQAGTERVSASAPASHHCVTAELFCIDVVELKGHLSVTFMDNGAGMTPCKLYCVLSFGFMEKTVKRDHPSTGLYGFKSGSMWLGKDAIIFIKTGGALSMGLLPQTDKDRVCTETVIIPLVSFSQRNKKMIVPEDSVPSLEAVLERTLFNTREELLAQFNAVPRNKGTCVLIWNIFRNKDGKQDLDFGADKHDIQIADFVADNREIPRRKVLHSQKMIPEFPGWQMGYSLRAYCSVLYLKPCMQIILQQKKVNA
ncbi:PREDICTED: MORC family CW-type zinc finger protein 4 [Cariama cristata]|uniref:MORC family CW-type zinc finger protein 4 n=1 Tax=Cariama cristata TaxID=54380 RepID=UPI0005203A0D|nr:PREDICTED: MORC family CW-type zinc finger protein 4 [Cariama cristata]